MPTGQGVTKVAGSDSLGWDWLPATPRSSTIPCITTAVGVPLGFEGEATDAEVVRAVLAGGAGRFGLLVRGLPRPFARHAARLLRSPDVAAEAGADAPVPA